MRVQVVGLEVFVCGECGREMSSAANLEAHLRLHSGERPFQCEDCPKAFVARHVLNKHVNRFHRGREIPKPVKKVFVCDFCERILCDKASLIHHVRKHTGEKPFGCEECGKRFFSKGEHTKHLRNPRAHDRTKCPQCDRTFATADGLTRHVFNYHEPPKPCEKCGACFSTKLDRLHHSISC